jgi:hypothetical protein
MYYNLICIFICTPICTKFYSCKKWVLQYLRCYLSLMDDDRRCFLEDRPLPHHLIMRVEELVQISVVALERLVTLPRQGAKGGLDDVVLVKIGSVGARVPLLHG